MPEHSETSTPGSAPDAATADDLMHAIRNQLGLIAGHANLLLVESTPGSESHRSAETIARACFTVSAQLQELAKRAPHSD